MVGYGSSDAVTFEPPEIVYAPILCNDTLTRDLVIVNNADCILKYELYHTQRAPSPDSIHPDDQLVPFGSEAVPKERTPAAELRVLVADAPRGHLPARSRTLVKLTFMPCVAGDFEFHVQCRVLSRAPDGSEITIDADASLANGVVEVIQGVPTAMETAMGYGHAEGELPAPTCALHAKSCFPNVVVSDVRVTGSELCSSGTDLWRQLSLSSLNATLTRPLSTAEVRFLAQSSPDLSKLPRFPIKFIPNVHNSGIQTLYLEILNPGHLDR